MIASQDKPRYAGGDWCRQLAFDFEWAKRSLLKQGRLPATLMVHTSKGVEAKVLCVHADRSVVMRVVSAAIVAVGGLGISLCSESWLAPHDGEVKIRPSQDPNRIDAVSAAVMFVQGGQLADLMRAGEIKRNARGAPASVVPIPWFGDLPKEQLMSQGYVGDCLGPVLLRQYTEEERAEANAWLSTMNQFAQRFQETLH